MLLLKFLKHNKLYLLKVKVKGTQQRRVLIFLFKFARGVLIWAICPFSRNLIFLCLLRFFFVNQLSELFPSLEKGHFF